MVANVDPDMQNRRPRIRYDTPVFFGFKASVSHSDNQTVDVALRYAATVLDTKVSAGAGYINCGMVANTGLCGSLNGGGEVLGAGIAATHSSGIGGNFHITSGDDRNRAAGIEPWLWNAQIHYGKKFSELGKTTIVGEYQYTDNLGAAGEEGEYWSVILEQKVDAAAMDVYLRYTNGDLTRPGVTFADDINLFGVGARMKF